MMDKRHGYNMVNGFLPGYTEWTVHGEHTISLPPSQSTNVNVEETFFGQEDIRGLVRDALGMNSLPLLINTQLGDTTIEGDTEESTENGDHGDEGVSYKRLLEECDKELYAGCKYSNLSFILHLYHIKCIGGISNKTFSMILELLRDAFPHLTALPSSAYEAKKFTKDLGLGYEKIHGPNDCMLYWDDRAGQQSCHICKASRYKSDEVGGSSKSRKSNKPIKVLRYFPLIPRHKRLYKCEKTAKDMRWHDTDPRSVRLGLASDGFNPFGTMSTSHSTWPVSLLQEENVDEEVLSLAIGPNIAAKQYKGFITNGYIDPHQEAA
ncbi:tetratricopeptide-like helical domain, DYW domain protein [Tanacetum coccineum]